MNTRRNTAAEEFTRDCLVYMTGFVLVFTSILSIGVILWAKPTSSHYGLLLDSTIRQAS